MKKLILGIGIPGSGKTTVLKPFAETHQYIYISPDELRAQFTGDTSDQTKNAEVWEETRRQVAKYFEEGRSVVVDATFADEPQQKAFIRFAREHGAEKVQGVFMRTSFFEALKRNAARDRVVPENILARMYRNLKDRPPITEDGFDSILDLNELGELERAETRGNREHLAIKEFNHRHKNL